MKVRITRIDILQREKNRITDCVAEDKPLRIFLDKTYHETILCSPSNLKELAVGHLLSEGVVKSVKEVEEVKLKEQATICIVKLRPTIDIEKRLKSLKPFSHVIPSTHRTSQFPQFSGRLPVIRSRLTVKAETISECVNHLNTIAKTFKETGGVHVAAIYNNDGSIVASAEDVGRHNAVDKVIGIAALANADFGNCFLALSGRLSGDIVFKAVRVGLPVVASLATALDSGIRIAERAGLSLIGFVRDKRMNVYTSPERILLD